MAYLFKTVPTHQVSVLAHRGLWGKYAPNQGTPENSRASLQAADDACMDAVELDVKMTSEGVPILMHDFNLGRTTNAYQFFRGGVKYDPMSNTGTNPAVSTVSWQTIQQMHLLSPSRDSVTGYFVPDIEGVFSYWQQHGLTTPMVFDTKTADAVSAIDRLAQEHFSSPQQVVAVKVNATLYPSYRAFRADAPVIRGIPVYTTNMLTKIDVPSSRANWQASSSALEINVKQKNGLLQGQLDSVQRAGDASGVFNAIPDGPGSGEFYSNDGHCCYRLSDLYFSYSGGKDTADNRGDWSYLVSQGFTFITTDDPRGLIGFLHSRGLH
ncbi:glycerophosphodiester phosphodiesterase family protein [Paraburkholderia kururiensis]|uniref:glycerophosphodiester phosphodiesterase family protein n=1 Tax=Paraburkholderia kururiensis TaxID=984307 RepID=UPI0005A64367|nr:glycerophosphodiester phosphodiesterase family protein [Paraburkholderia kururiensis]